MPNGAIPEEGTMKLVQYMKKFFLPVCMAVVLISCASQPILIEHPDRFFWEIKAENASIYVQGTIHVADKDFYPLSDAVLAAFDNSDRLVSEIGGITEIQAFMAEMQKIIVANMNTDPAKNILSLLSEEEIAVLYAVIGEEAAGQLAVFNPWILNTALASAIVQTTSLNAADGIDLYFMQRAGEKPIAALESAEQQIAALSYGSFEDQLLILKQTIADLQNSEKMSEELIQLCSLYRANDKKGLTALLTEMEKYPDSFSQEKKQAFIDTLFKDRNARWVKQFNEYLQAGGKTFVFAGAGHFLGESNVFDLMRQQKLLK